MKRASLITVALLTALSVSHGAWAVDYPLPRLTVGSLARINGGRYRKGIAICRRLPAISTRRRC